jgi:hypothetical protein
VREGQWQRTTGSILCSRLAIQHFNSAASSRLGKSLNVEMRHVGGTSRL